MFGNIMTLDKNKNKETTEKKETTKDKEKIMETSERS